MSNILFLGSKSNSRQRLLKESRIPFNCVDQDADESSCDWDKSFKDILESIAIHKMNHVVLPGAQEGDICFVLTADTMGIDDKENIHGKPKDKQDAIKKIKTLRGSGTVGTAFCLDKKEYTPKGWQLCQRIVQCIEASYIFDMPDHWIEKYLKDVPEYMHYSGALSIEGFSAQFLKSIDGSYTTILGLPMFEVRQALDDLRFFI